VRVRRALTLAIDRRQLVRALNLPEELRLTDVIFTSRQYWSNELPPLLPYDTVEAARLLTDAGWIDTDEDGVRDNDGSPLRFEVVLDAGSVTERAAILVQAQLRQVGVAMELRPLENRVWRGKLNSSDYDAAFAPLYNAIDGHLRWLGEKARFGYDNPAVVELLASVKETADQDEIDAIYREIMPIIRADLPMTILFPQVQTYAVDRRLRGLESPYRGDPILFMEDLWLDAR
jgi:peptide/nickel transport system substrate-binding protein